MDDAGENVEWTPQRSMLSARGHAEGRARGPRWLVSMRALVVVLAMMAAALGVLWLESAGVQDASAQLVADDAGKVAVPSLDGTVALKPGGAAGGAEGGSKGTAKTRADSPSPSTGPPPSATVLPAAGVSSRAGALPEGGLVVHVAGAVKTPGVFILNPDSRVFQAIEAAGGALHTAELAALNLAAPLSDGLQILVPTVEQAAAMNMYPGNALPGSGAAAKAATDGGQGSGKAGSVGPLNVNTASQTELETLPGVGPVLAERIVAWRLEHGPYPSVDALDAVNGIGTKLLAGLRDLVVAG